MTIDTFVQLPLDQAEAQPLLRLDGHPLGIRDAGGALAS